MAGISARWWCQSRRLLLDDRESFDVWQFSSQHFGAGTLRFSTVLSLPLLPRRVARDAVARGGVRRTPVVGAFQCSASSHVSRCSHWRERAGLYRLSLGLETFFCGFVLGRCGVLLSERSHEPDRTVGTATETARSVSARRRRGVIFRGL